MRAQGVDHSALGHIPGRDERREAYRRLGRVRGALSRRADWLARSDARQAERLRDAAVLVARLVETVGDVAGELPPDRAELVKALGLRILGGVDAGELVAAAEHRGVA